MKLAMALKQYFEGDQHIKGEKIALADLKPFVLDTTSRVAYVAELRSYGYEVED